MHSQSSSRHTWRWALAWSFTDARLPDVSYLPPSRLLTHQRLVFHQDVARPSAPALHRLLPPRTTFRQRLDHAPPAARALQQVLGALAGESEPESEAGLVVGAPVSEVGGGAYVVVARRDTWSHAARRKKTQQVRAGPHTPTESGTGGTGAGEGGRAALVAHVWVEEKCVMVGKRKGESGVQQLVV
jgi:hypothetical protein